MNRSASGLKASVTLLAGVAFLISPSGADPVPLPEAKGAGGGAGGSAMEQKLEDQGYERILRQSRRGRFSKHGWNHYGPGHFELDAETGVLKSHGGMGLFWYAAKELGDFELQLEFMTEVDNANSGVFLRVPGVPTSDDYIYHSWEIQIHDASEGIHQTGAVYDAEAPTRMASKGPGRWNQMKITFVGDQITVELNGEKIVDWQAEPRGKVEDWAPRGYIGLQNHDRETSTMFRNIFVKELDS